MTSDRASWLAAAAWGAAALVALFAFPPAGVAMAGIGVLVTGGVAVTRRRLHALSGALIGFGGTFVAIWAARAVGCAVAIECEMAATDSALVATALVVLGAGLALALLERRMGERRGGGLA